MCSFVTAPIEVNLYRVGPFATPSRSKQTLWSVCPVIRIVEMIDDRGVVQRRREVINSRRWSALIEHSIGMIGYRSTLFSGDRLGYKLTTLYPRHLHWCITGTKGTEVTAKWRQSPTVQYQRWTGGHEKNWGLNPPNHRQFSPCKTVNF